MLEGHPHDYDRHDTTSLFAAMNVTEGTVIARTHRRHRDVKLKKFMQKHDCDKLLHPQALTRDLLHRSDHDSVQALEQDLPEWVAAWTRTPNPSSEPRPSTTSSLPSTDT